MIIKVIEQLEYKYPNEKVPAPKLNKDIVVADVKKYSIQQDMLNYTTRDNEEDGLIIGEYTTEDYAIIEDDIRPTVTHYIDSVYLMNDEGKTIERIK